MSEESKAQPAQQVIVQQTPSNGLGTAGFIVSLVGLVTCGLLCPIGLLLSVFGLLKPPRGFAIAGTLIGGLGSIGFVLFGLAFITALLGFGAAADQAIKDMDSQMQQSMQQLEQDLQDINDPDFMADPALPLEVSPESVEPTSLDGNPPTPPDGQLSQPAEPASDPPTETREYRTFSDRTGQFETEAVFVGLADGNVVLKKRDGKIIQVPEDKLNEEDLQWCREEFERRTNK
jgi:hypothetical protein